MQFYQSRKKHTEVPIVPLLDILVILLIYFIVTTEQKKKRDILEVEIPNAYHLNTKQQLSSSVQLVVAADGKISLDGGIIPEGTLVDSLLAYMDINKGRSLEVKADKDVTLQQQLFILKSLKEAGIQNAPWLIKKESQK